MNKYTSIELSRLIQRKVPEVETEYGWTNEGHGDKWYIVPRDQQYWDTYYSVSVEHNAYRLDDVLRAIKVWGEKQGKMGVCDTCGVENIKQCLCICAGVEDWDVWYSHSLLAAYLADDGFGERTEGVIRSIFEV